MTSLLRPELRASLQSMLPKGPSKEEPSNVYRDPEPPIEMQNKPVPASGPVNPNAGMMGKALAIQRERNKKAMMNPSAASPSGRVRTGVPFNEAPRGRGMQTPMNLPTPMMNRNPPEPVLPPEQVMITEPKTPPMKFEPEPVRHDYSPSEPVMPEREPPRDIPMAVQRQPRRILKVGESPVMQSYAKGGMVKTASSRGDGIASRGRTRGKIC